MSALQDSRKELMVQLEGLMKLLKVQDEEVENSFAVDNCVFCSNKTEFVCLVLVWKIGRYLQVKLNWKGGIKLLKDKVTGWVRVY